MQYAVCMRDRSLYVYVIGPIMLTKICIIGFLIFLIVNYTMIVSYLISK